MGAGSSKLNVPSQNCIGAFTICLHPPGHLYITSCDQQILQIISTAFTECYKPGIASVKQNGTVIDVKLEGRPMVIGSSRAKSLGAKTALLNAVVDLRNAEWELILSADLARNIDLSVMFFQKRIHLGKNTDNFACINPSESDRLQFISNSPASRKGVVQAVAKSWPHGTQVSDSGDVIDITFPNDVWKNESEDGIAGKKCLLEIIRSLQDNSYRLYGTANVKGTTDSIILLEESGLEFRQYWMLAPSGSDRITLIGSPPSIREVIKQTIISTWSQGLAGEEELENAFEFQLNGLPWNCSGTKLLDSVELFSELLCRLRYAGWRPKLSTDLSRLRNDKTTFVFESCRPALLAHAAIVPQEVDKLLLLNVSTTLRERLIEVITSRWPKGIKITNDPENSHRCKLKLGGLPWVGRNMSDFLQVQYLIMNVLLEIRDSGWKLVTAADLCGRVWIKSGAAQQVDMAALIIAQSDTVI